MNSLSKDSDEPPDRGVVVIDSNFDILTTNLEKAVDVGTYVLDWAAGFLNNNSEINNCNEPEYEALWESLDQVNRSAIHMCHIDPSNFLQGDKEDITEKKVYADRLRKYIHGRGILLGTIPKVAETRGTILDGEYDFLNPKTAIPD